MTIERKMGRKLSSTRQLLCLSVFSILALSIPKPTDANLFVYVLNPLKILHNGHVVKAEIVAHTRLISKALIKVLDDGGVAAKASKKYLTRLNETIGWFPDPGTHQREGIFNVITKAYNSRIVIDYAYRQARKYGQNISDEEENALHYKGKIDVYYRNYNACQFYLEEKQNSWTKSKERGLNFNGLLQYLKDTDGLITSTCLSRNFKDAVTNLVNYTLRGYNAALFITTLQLDIINDFDRYSVNGRKTRWEAPVGPIHRMLKDTDESLDAIEEGLKELRKNMNEATQNNDRDYWEGVLKKMEDKSKKPPYKELYGGGTTTKSTEIIDNARKTWEEFKRETVKLRGFRPFYQRYKYDLAAFMEDIEGPVLEEFWTISESVYKKYLEVKLLLKGETGLDPEWNFDLKKPLQKLRVGWDHLDSLAEEIKCYLRKSYWLDLRNKTVRDTQIDLEKGRIFGHFSRTLYQPCRNTDTDLIAQCNHRNHEICRPSEPSEAQEKYIQLTGDLSIYRPKWVYNRMETDPPGLKAECVGERTYVIPLKLCRCGFILDCGKDIGVDLKCVLQENDDMRKQCKGSVGYPCRTIPLAPKRHHASCVTGSCDITMNSCEWDRPNY